MILSPKTTFPPTSSKPTPKTSRTKIMPSRNKCLKTTNSESSSIISTQKKTPKPPSSSSANTTKKSIMRKFSQMESTPSKSTKAKSFTSNPKPWAGSLNSSLIKFIKTTPSKKSPTKDTTNSSDRCTNPLKNTQTHKSFRIYSKSAPTFWTQSTTTRNSSWNASCCTPWTCS